MGSGECEIGADEVDEENAWLHIGRMLGSVDCDRYFHCNPPFYAEAPASDAASPRSVNTLTTSFL